MPERRAHRANRDRRRPPAGRPRCARPSRARPTRPAALGAERAPPFAPRLTDTFARLRRPAPRAPRARRPASTIHASAAPGRAENASRAASSPNTSMRRTGATRSRIEPVPGAELAQEGARARAQREHAQVEIFRRGRGARGRGLDHAHLAARAARRRSARPTGPAPGHDDARRSRRGRAVDHALGEQAARRRQRGRAR